MTSHEENTQSTSQSSDSVTTGPGSFFITNGYKEFEMNDSRDESKTGSCVDQGADNLEPPRALYTTGEDLPRTGYEPKSSSTRVVGGAQNYGGENPVQHTTSTASVPCAGGESGELEQQQGAEWKRYEGEFDNIVEDSCAIQFGQHTLRKCKQRLRV